MPEKTTKKNHIKAQREEDIAEAKEILAEDLKGKTVTIVRDWKGAGRPDGKQGRHTTRVPPLERAEMMKTIITHPDIKGKEFAKKFGYAITEEGKVSQAAYAMIDVLKDEISGYKIPEMEEILRADLLVVAHGMREILRRLKDEPDNVAINELSLAVDKSFKRSRLLQGKSTSNVAVNVDVGTMSESELDAFLSEGIRVKVSSPEEE